MASDRSEWRQSCKEGISTLEEGISRRRAEKQARRHAGNQRVAAGVEPQGQHICDLCGKACRSRIGLLSHTRWHQRQPP